MRTPSTNLIRSYWVLVVLAFIGVGVMVVTYTPIEKSMGAVQKIFYLHLPVAINTFLAAFVVFIASIGYLWQRTAVWDDLACAAAKVTTLLCGVVLLTGMIWGHSAWGQWWTWSPRLTFSLVLFMLFLTYVMLRPSIESPQRRAMVSAVYGIAAFLDVPLVYLSVKLLPDIHPTSIEMTSEMGTTLALWFIPVTMLTGGLIATRFTLSRRERLAHQRSSDALFSEVRTA